MGQVEQVKHAKDERVTQRKQRVDAAPKESVDDLLGHAGSGLTRLLQNLKLTVLDHLSGWFVLTIAAGQK
jgi:hypothetical protein